jgi:hypothetical protein
MVLDALQLVATLAVIVAVLYKRKDVEDSRASLGMEYARMALLYARNKDADRSALEAFRIIDSMADGRRDFTDAQARVFLDAADSH